MVLAHVVLLLHCSNVNYGHAWAVDEDCLASTLIYLSNPLTFIVQLCALT